MINKISFSVSHHGGPQNSGGAATVSHSDFQVGRASRFFAASVLAALISALALTGQPALGAEAPSIEEFVLAKDVVEREPVEVTENFNSTDERAVAFVRVNNPGEAAVMRFLWYRDDVMHAQLKMRVGTSPSWRTWSSVRLQPGLWRVQLVMADGSIIEQKNFRVGDLSSTAISELPGREPSPDFEAMEDSIR